MPKRPGKRGEKRRTLDERLFRAWQAGDAEACAEIWKLFHACVYSVAVRFCSRFVDNPTAEQVATTAFGNAWEELELGGTLEKAGKQRIFWMGGPQLESYVRNLVILRCRDGLKPQWRWLTRLVSSKDTDDEAGIDPLEALAACQPTREEELVRSDQGQLALMNMVKQFAALAELCRARPRLLSVVAAMRDYLRGCLAEAGRRERDEASDGRDWDDLSLDELAETVSLELVDANQTEMYQYIRLQLGLVERKHRNTFDQRMKDIRDILEGLGSRTRVKEERGPNAPVRIR